MTWSVSTTEFGWHGGGGAEIRMGKHFGLHGDYRYTFLDFNDDDDDEIDGIGVIGRLAPGPQRLDVDGRSDGLFLRS